MVFVGYLLCSNLSFKGTEACSRLLFFIVSIQLLANSHTAILHQWLPSSTTNTSNSLTDDGFGIAIIHLLWILWLNSCMHPTWPNDLIIHIVLVDNDSLISQRALTNWCVLSPVLGQCWFTCLESLTLNLQFTCSRGSIGEFLIVRRPDVVNILETFFLYIHLPGSVYLRVSAVRGAALLWLFGTIKPVKDAPLRLNSPVVVLFTLI